MDLRMVSAALVWSIQETWAAKPSNKKAVSSCSFLHLSFPDFPLQNDMYWPFYVNGSITCIHKSHVFLCTYPHEKLCAPIVEHVVSADKRVRAKKYNKSHVSTYVWTSWTWLGIVIPIFNLSVEWKITRLSIQLPPFSVQPSFFFRTGELRIIVLIEEEKSHT